MAVKNCMVGLWEEQTLAGLCCGSSETLQQFPSRIIAASILQQSKVGFVPWLSASHTASSLLAGGLLLNVGREGRFLPLSVLASPPSSPDLLKTKRKGWGQGRKEGKEKKRRGAAYSQFTRGANSAADRQAGRQAARTEVKAA